MWNPPCCDGACGCFATEDFWRDEDNELLDCAVAKKCAADLPAAFDKERLNAHPTERLEHVMNGKSATRRPHYDYVVATLFKCPDFAR